MISAHLLDAYPIISDQVNKTELQVILRECEKVLEQNISGDITEFGCYIGTTSLFLRRLLNHYNSDKALHVYDSFEGLPEKTSPDSSPAGTQFKAGELTVGKKQLLREFQKANLKPPVIHKSWFSDLTTQDVPEHIAFAYLDGDFYESILDPLKLVWPRLDERGIITIDDYGREALPGVERAVKYFFQGKDVHIHHEHSIAIISRF